MSRCQETLELQQDLTSHAKTRKRCVSTSPLLSLFYLLFDPPPRGGGGLHTVQTVFVLSVWVTSVRLEASGAALTCGCGVVFAES
jgi:hypothetical protein